MSAPTVTRSADRLTAVSVALQRIAEQVPADAQVMRGAFYGVMGADVELQLDTIDHALQTVEGLRCGLVHETCDLERGELTGQLRRRHLWVGHVCSVPTIIWAFEDVDELPEQGARFPDGHGSEACPAPEAPEA
jgi:hypothetical protein